MNVRRFAPSLASPFRRPEIQGLRGLAILVVVSYHSGLPFLTGGFVGVDIFFVVSGFLITGNLLREHAAFGRVRLRRFAVARLGRLAPMALLLTLLTLLSAKLFVAPLLLPEIARDGLSSLFAVTNLRLALTGTNYLASESPSPFQHYWSLGVEEQFYLVWPVVLVALLLVARGRRRVVFATCAVLVAVSFGACLWLTGVSQPWSFFGSPTRAWELGAGALLAVGGDRLRIRGRAGVILGWIGLIALLASAGVFDSSTVWPGVATLVPVMATGMVLIAGGDTRGLDARRVLSLRALTVVGDVSYSFYLWHWPLLVIPALALGRDLPVGWALASMALALGLSVASSRFIERPTARLIRRARSRQAFAMAGVATGLVAVVALGVGTLPRLSDGTTVASPTLAEVRAGLRPPVGVPSNLTPSLGDVAKDVPRIYEDGCHAGTGAVSSPRCLYGDLSTMSGSRPQNVTGGVVLFGDSHAAQWFSPVESIAAQHGLPFLNLTKSACPSAAVTVSNESLDRTYTECDAWRAAALKRIADFQPSVIVLSNAGRGYRDLVDPGRAFDDLWSEGLASTIEDLPEAASVVVLADTPRWEASPAVCLSAHLHDVAGCAAPVGEVIDTRLDRAEKAAVESSGATFVPSRTWLCSTTCSGVLANRLVYRDSNHLTDSMARLLSPRITAALVQHDILH